MTNEVKVEEVGYVWNWSCPVGDGQQISVSSNFAKGVSVAEINAEFDKIGSVFNRQQAKSASIGLEQDIERLVNQKKQIIDTIARVDNKSEAKGGLGAAERQQREAAVNNLESLSTNIDSKQKLLQKLIDEAK